MKLLLSKKIEDKYLINIIQEGLFTNNINRTQIISKKDQQLLDASDK